MAGMLLFQTVLQFMNILLPSSFRINWRYIIKPRYSCQYPVFALDHTSGKFIAETGRTGYNHFVPARLLLTRYSIYRMEVESMKKCRFFLVLVVCFALLLTAACAAQNEDGSWELWGVTVRPEDTSVLFPGGKTISNFQPLYELLDAMPDLKEVDLDQRVLGPSKADALMTRYPDITFRFTVKINEAHSFHTSQTAFSTLGRTPRIQNGHWFSMMKGLKALDVGHQYMKTLEWLDELPQLKILIVVDNYLADKDIQAIAGQRELEYIEIFKNRITDLTPFSGLTQLRDLNVAYNNITDLSPLYDLPCLERLSVMGNPKLSKEEIERFKEHQPNCLVITNDKGPNGDMIDDNGEIVPDTSWKRFWRYDTVYWIFHHDEYVGWDAEVTEAPY